MILNHLWQSSLFVVLVWVLTLALRRNRAAVRYWLWLAASVKFLVPFAILVSLGSQFEWRTAPVMSQPQVSFVMEEMSRASAAPIVVPVAAPAFNFAPVLIGIWFCGFAIGIVLWTRSWLHVRGALRAGRRNRLPHLLQMPHMHHLPIRISSTRMEPGVFGIFRPVLLLPEGIADRLTPAQLEAILAHELCHVRRRDNLTAAIHMAVETIFWFHPLVWWIRARLIDERERACDEEVLRMGNEAEVYAAGILEACKLYLESPLACVSGVTGSDLKKRIEAIMKNRITHKLGLSSKVLLAAAGFVAVAGPLIVGIMDAPAVRAQSGAVPAPKFEVAAVRPATQDNEHSFDTDKGRFLAHNVTLQRLIAYAYGMDIGLISGGPKWMDSDSYDINAKIPEEFAEHTSDEVRLMLQGLLADRFRLVIHREPSQVSGYVLVVAKNGPKMEHANPEVKGLKIRTTRNAHLIAESVTMEAFAKDLSHNPDVGKLVVDKTGLSGRFKFELDWMPERLRSSPESSSDDRPSIFTALQEHLGLKLESAKIPTSAIVIDHAERPSGNDQAFFRRVLWTPQEFEVASVKPSPSDATDRSLGTRPGGRLSTENATAKQLIYFAYDVMPFQVSGGPDWVGSVGFDIEAKPADPNASKEQIRQMVQKLLAERFRLKFHMEAKEMPIYALAVGRRGSKLVEDHSENTHANMMNGRGEMTGVKATMPMLASSLSRVLQRQVVDETGLKGTYTFKLQFLPDQSTPRPDEDGASIFTALQEQLGLSLRAGRGPVKVLVIDSAEKPSGN